MKNYSLSIFRDLSPSISCCKSATRVVQGLGLRARPRVRAEDKVRIVT